MTLYNIIIRAQAYNGYFMYLIDITSFPLGNFILADVYCVGGGQSVFISHMTNRP